MTAGNEYNTICELLEQSKNIAVIGFSKDPLRTSRRIASYLVENNYKVFGVNPTIDSEEIDGIKIYKSLRDIPVQIDIVNVFRRSKTIGDLIQDVLHTNPKALWLQSGIRNDEAVKPVADKGITTIQDQCILVEHGQCIG